MARRRLALAGDRLYLHRSPYAPRAEGTPTMAQRRASRRAVVVSLDGESRAVAMSTSELATFRRRIQPYTSRARVVASPPLDLAVRMRAARLAAASGASAAAAGGTGAGLDALIARTAEIYARGLADQTRAAYARRWAAFEAWCDQASLSSLPASVDTLFLYIAALAGLPKPPALGTVRGHVAAINRMHRDQALPSPVDDPAMSVVMRGLSRTLPGHGAGPQVRALRIEELRAVCRSLGHPDPILVRDSALLHLFHAGLSAAELTRLRWRDIAWRDGRVVLGLRATHRAEPDTFVSLVPQPDLRLCPVNALRAWQQLTAASPALVFTAVDRNGYRSPVPMKLSTLRQTLLTRHSSLAQQRPDGSLDVIGLLQLLDQTPNAALRDRALLLLGFAGAFRRGELTRLLWSDCRFDEAGLVVHLRRSKTDPAGHGRDVGIPYGRSLLTCPVRAMQTWKAREQQQLAARFVPGSPCFPGLGRAGRILDKALSEEGLTMVVRRRAAGAGLAGRYGGRSLRAGFISTAADLDIPLELVAVQSRHATLDNLVRYIRHDDLFRRNAAEQLGL